MNNLRSNDSSVPLTILTGFLGAGKTTLLNHILSSDHGLKVGVLVNDFGSINIDAELVVNIDQDMISLANGCVCCQIRDDLLESVGALLERSDSIEYILLEASGVADPSSIFMTFIDSKHRDRIRLDSVTCVVDAEQAFAYADEYPQLAMLKLRQIAFADMVILNKVDLAGKQQVERVKTWIDEHMNRVRIVETNHCNVPMEILLAVGRFNPAQQASEFRHPEDSILYAHKHVDKTDHGEQFSTWSYESDQPFSLQALKQMIKRHLPASVFRCKGVVYVADAPNQRAVLQVVGRRTEITLIGEWDDRPRATQIVAIGAPEGIDSTTLRNAFDACIST